MAKAPHVKAQVIDALIAATETTIAHNLGYQPQELFVLRRDAGTDIFRGSTTWDATNVYLQCGSNTVNARLFIF